jgi:hypothetical protein
MKSKPLSKKTPIIPTRLIRRRADGLPQSVTNTAVHLLRQAGDVNIHRCHTSSHMGIEKMTLGGFAYIRIIIAQDKTFLRIF